MSRFTWGDPVRVLSNAPSRFQPGNVGSICTVDLIETEVLAEHVGGDVGEFCHVVEWLDGSDTVVPAKWLEPRN